MISQKAFGTPAFRVLTYLRTSGFITIEQEKGVESVYRFVGPGLTSRWAFRNRSSRVGTIAGAVLHVLSS